MAITVVQSKSGTVATGTVLTISFNTVTTLGNCLVATMISGSTSLSLPKLGGAADNWTVATTATGDPGVGAIYIDPNCTGAQTAITLTQAASNPFGATIYEVAGLLTTGVLDKSTHNTVDGSTTYTSNITATTAQNSEIFFGSVGGFGNDFVHFPILSGPVGWTFTPQLNWSTGIFQFSGYDIVSSTGTAQFNGTDSNGGADGGGVAYIALVATLKGSTATTITGTGTMGMSAFGLTGSGFGGNVTGTGTMGMSAFGLTGSGTAATYGSATMGRPAFGMTGAGQVYGSIVMNRPALGMTGTGTQLITGTGTMGMAAKGMTGSGFGGNVTGTGTMGLPAKGALGSGFGGNVSGTATMGMSAFGMTGVSSYTFLPFKYVGDVPVLYLQYFDGVAATTLEAVPGSGYLLIAEPNNFYPLSIPPQDGRWISQTLNPSVSIPEFNAVPGLAVPGRIEIGYPGNINESFSLVEEMKAALPVGHMWYRTKSAYQTLGQRRRKRRSANP